MTTFIVWQFCYGDIDENGDNMIFGVFNGTPEAADEMLAKLNKGMVSPLYSMTKPPVITTDNVLRD